jgi:hypothetical protein
MKLISTVISVLEIVTKLCDPEFNRRAKTSDFYARTWDVFLKARGDGPDKVCSYHLFHAC